MWQNCNRFIYKIKLLFSKFDIMCVVLLFSLHYITSSKAKLVTIEEKKQPSKVGVNILSKPHRYNTNLGTSSTSRNHLVLATRPSRIQPITNTICRSGVKRLATTFGKRTTCCHFWYWENVTLWTWADCIWNYLKKISTCKDYDISFIIKRTLSRIFF